MMYDWEDDSRQQRTQEHLELISVVKDVVDSPAGYQFLSWLLLSMDAEGHVSASEYDRALRNKAEDILALVGEASWQKMINLISDIRMHRQHTQKADNNE